MAMEKVLSSAALRRELGDNGRRRVEALDLDRVASRLLEALP
jgi:glycosyltransferase involved in cell wall biosynthesis